MSVIVYKVGERNNILKQKVEPSRLQNALRAGWVLDIFADDKEEEPESEPEDDETEGQEDEPSDEDHDEDEGPEEE